MKRVRLTRIIFGSEQHQYSELVGEVYDMGYIPSPGLNLHAPFDIKDEDLVILQLKYSQFDQLVYIYEKS